MSKAGDGVCAIKQEFLIQRPPKNVNEENEFSANKRKITSAEEDSNSDTKRVKDENTNREQVGGRDKKRGQNKARPKTYQDNKENKLCPSLINIQSPEELQECRFTGCKFIHNLVEYLKNKPKDLGETCHVFNVRGRCPRGLECRFGSVHISDDGYNIIDMTKFQAWKDDTKNALPQTVQSQLQKKTYDFSYAEKLVKQFDKRNKGNKPNMTDSRQCEQNVASSGAITDEDIIKLLPREKKTIDWRDKLYLSPLTTLGNLPFRRICKQFGADITCGEMALCESLLKGLKQEWALVKRHESEDIFGAQICGSNAYVIAKVAQLLQENTELDFIDLNLGCPIDLIYRKGGGCGMMHRLGILETSVKSASTLLNIPFTVKMRTGVYQDKKITHTIVPKMADWGASLVTIHGRSREARYARSADWEYIEACAKAADPCPVFGNGDILSYEGYLERRQLAPTAQGVMIGRGALIKPWVFTEIKEQRMWDISSKERFEIIKKFTNYGLEHWGSDMQGVEKTRRFLLEWLSFLYRYVPVGLLEQPPQKINERHPSFFGRDDLETLMISGNCADWIKISEMILGPVPDGFVFLPKHRANSY